MKTRDLTRVFSYLPP